MGKQITCATMMIEDEEINIDGYVEYTVDNRYGEDADGNRGVSRTEVQDVSDICAFKANGEEVFLDGKQLQRASDILTRKFLEG